MRKSKPVIKYRRKKQGKTSYKKRLNMLKSGLPRLVIRISSNEILVQCIEYFPDGDRVVFACHSKQLQKLGWKAHRTNAPAAYLIGYLCGKKVKEQKKKLIFDTNKSNITKGSNVYAALKGVLDAGLDVIHSEEIFPKLDRISGKHIEEYANKIKGTDAYNKQFSSYIKNGFSPEDIQKHFEEIKQKIDSKA
ncbi:MAG: 50S ribosomal protein L18 [Nanoarchaeota archaeon]|nr:50S ribosomal protein L18 [Nanoarchaeota archaeon]